VWHYAFFLTTQNSRFLLPFLLSLPESRCDALTLVVISAWSQMLLKPFWKPNFLSRVVAPPRTHRFLYMQAFGHLFQAATPLCYFVVFTYLDRTQIPRDGPPLSPKILFTSANCLWWQTPPNTFLLTFCDSVPMG